jgi:hypothetical protein
MALATGCVKTRYQLKYIHTYIGDRKTSSIYSISSSQKHTGRSDCIVTRYVSLYASVLQIYKFSFSLIYFLFNEADNISDYGAPKCRMVND